MLGRRDLLLSILAILMIFCFVSCEDSTGPKRTTSPVISPDSGLYDLETLLSITCSDADAQIRYTIGGEEPGPSSPLYSQALPIADLMPAYDNQFTLKARSFKQGYSPSLIVSKQYSFNYENTVASPQIHAADYILPTGAAFSITCATPETQIRYTLDGSDPGIMSSLYSTQVILNLAGFITINARAFHLGWNPSPVTASNHLLRPPLIPMVFVKTDYFSNGIGMVVVNGFWMDRTELTQEDYHLVMNSVCPEPPDTRNDIPIYSVSWFNAIEYCNRRSLLFELTPCYSYQDAGTNPSDWPQGWDANASNHSKISWNRLADGFRLPTEMEWMCAAWGGSGSPDFIYSGSNLVNEVAWCRTNSGSAIHPIQSLGGNQLGIYDLGGNVWEWCWDVYGSYPTAPQVDPIGPKHGSKRVLRGGGWASDSLNCTIISRYSDKANFKSSPSIGFRTARGRHY